MNLVELAVVVGVIALLAVGGTAWHDRRLEADLDLDLVRVQEVARQYAAVRCANPPAGPQSLADVLAELGSGSIPVKDPARWTVLVTARPGRMGTVSAVRYAAPPDVWQTAHLLGRRNAIRTATGVELPIDVRRKTAPNQGSFQLLLENQLC